MRSPARSRSLLGVTVLGSLLGGGCASQRAAAGPGQLDPQLVALAATASGVGKVELRADENGALTKISLHHRDAASIPEPVRKLAETKYPGAKVDGYESEHYAEGGRVHEVELVTADGRHCEISADGAGALRYTECRVAPDELPAPVRKTVADTLANAQVEEAELVQGPGIEEYRVEARTGGVLHYLRMRPTGELARHGIRIPGELEVPVRP